MRKRASVLVALLAAMAVLVPTGAASAAMNPNLSQIINGGALSVDIVDGSGVSVASPSLAFGATNFSFACQQTTATFGTASQKVGIKNPVSGGVKIDINSTTPATDKWTSGGNNYKYNGSGCTDGQLTITDGTFTKTSGVGTPAYTMPVGAFSGSSAVTLFNNTGTTRYEGSLTGYTFTQDIPAEQTDGTYTLPMTVTYLAQ